MTQAITRKLNDSFVARWAALILIALMMFFAYMFVDVLSPLQTMLETARSWTPEIYGSVVSSEYFLNVFALFLIFAGIILDKTGIRFSGLFAASLMVIGAAIKLYGISDYFSAGGFGYDFFNSFWTGFPPSAKVTCIGFAIFGCGTEMAGITVSKAIVKWFTGKELALAMGLEMAIARLGVFAVFRMSPWLANMAPADVVRPVAVIGLLLCIGFITYLAFTIMDRKLDKQTGVSKETANPEDEFKVKDLGKLFGSGTFMLIAILCVLYYSAIFPFQKFATSMFQSQLGLTAGDASKLVSWFPIGAMILTPFLGAFLDFKGKGATMLIIGAILLCGCHLVFALVPMTMGLAYVTIVVLGVSFSLVPVALWPSVPKLVENRYLGSGYSVIFWIQNLGLLLTPIIIGFALSSANPDIASNIKTLNDEITALEVKSVELSGGDIQVLDQQTGIAVEAEAISAPDGDAVMEAAPESLQNQAVEDLTGLEQPIIEAVPTTDRIAEINAQIEMKRKAVEAETMKYDYTIPMLIFASFGAIAILLGIFLKRLDKKKGYGLELPNVQK